MRAFTPRGTSLAPLFFIIPTTFHPLPTQIEYNIPVLEGQLLVLEALPAVPERLTLVLEGQLLVLEAIFQGITQNIPL